MQLPDGCALLQYSDDADVARGAVQINGADVLTREQAIQMFAESRDNITLLLTRPVTQVCDCCNYTTNCSVTVYVILFLREI